MASVPLTEFGPMVRAAREAKGWSQEALAAEALGNSTRKGYISDVENAKYPGISAMTAQRLIDALGLDKSLITRLRGVTAPDDREIDAEISRLRAQLGGLEAALSDLQHQSRDTLIALATRFGQETAHLLPDGTLRSLLADKAREHANYQKIIAALDDRVAAIANLKGAAKDAAARLDFDEVETLLSRVHEVELDIAAATSEARAENALLQGKADRAYTLFSAAADSFAGIGPVDVAERRRSYAERLITHGIRYGGQGLPLAIRLLDRLLTDLPREAAPLEWGYSQNSLAVACRVLGARTKGSSGMEILSRSTKAYSEALLVFTPAENPVLWAGTMQNFALALQAESENSLRPASIALLSRSLEAYRECLQVCTRENEPYQWALTMQNLAGALRRLGDLIDGSASAAALMDAISAYQEALQVLTQADYPLRWAGTLQNMAVALVGLARRTEGKQGSELFAVALSAYENALQVRSLAEFPVDWATTQCNIATCLHTWSQHPSCEERPDILRRASQHVDAALTVFDPGHMAYFHSTATRLRADILTALAANS